MLAEERFAEFGDELAVIAYGHESEPTAALSREADVRLIWGGDETVERLRAVPVGPAAHDLAFGDRFSFAVLRPGAVLDADDQARSTLAEQLYNDAYWFDQQGCASPRLLVWVGERAEADEARQVLFGELARTIAAKGYRLEAGAALAKLTFMYGALIDRPVESVHQAGTSSRSSRWSTSTASIARIPVRDFSSRPASTRCQISRASWPARTRPSPHTVSPTRS